MIDLVAYVAKNSYLKSAVPIILRVMTYNCHMGDSFDHIVYKHIFWSMNIMLHWAMLNKHSHRSIKTTLKTDNPNYKSATQLNIHLDIVRLTFKYIKLLNRIYHCFLFDKFRNAYITFDWGSYYYNMTILPCMPYHNFILISLNKRVLSH